MQKLFIPIPYRQINYKVPNARVHISVASSGICKTEEHRARLFGKFQSIVRRKVYLVLLGKFTLDSSLFGIELLKRKDYDKGAKKTRKTDLPFLVPYQNTSQISQQLEMISINNVITTREFCYQQSYVYISLTNDELCALTYQITFIHSVQLCLFLYFRNLKYTGIVVHRKENCATTKNTRIHQLLYFLSLNFNEGSMMYILHSNITTI